MLSAMTSPAPTQQGILNLRLADLEALHKAYMPFIKLGGLFVPTNNRYQLGQEVFVLVFLPDETGRRPVAGRVAWISPAGTGGRPPGVGIQFMEGPKSEELKNHIDVLLAGYEHKERVTHTM